MNLVADLAAALAVEFPDMTIVDHPVEQVPGIPSMVIYPDDPYVVPGTYCRYEVNVNIGVFQTRLNDRDSMDLATSTLEGVAAAITKAGGAWQEMTLQPVDIGGISYLMALHSVVLYDHPEA